MTGTVAVLIVDDQVPFRAAAAAVVKATAGFEVVGEAVSGEAAIEQVAALDPGLVLMDINMPGLSGIEATRQITSERPQVRVVLLSTYNEDDLPADARACGAVAYVHKEEFGPETLVAAWAQDSGASP